VTGHALPFRDATPPATPPGGIAARACAPAARAHFTALLEAAGLAMLWLKILRRYAAENNRPDARMALTQVQRAAAVGAAEAAWCEAPCLQGIAYVLWGELPTKTAEELQRLVRENEAARVYLLPCVSQAIQLYQECVAAGGACIVEGGPGGPR
jgi:hypothetical protein